MEYMSNVCLFQVLQYMHRSTRNHHECLFVDERKRSIFLKELYILTEQLGSDTYTISRHPFKALPTFQAAFKSYFFPIGSPWLTTENHLQVKYEFSMACFLCLNIIWMAFELQVYGTFAGEELTLLPAVDGWRRKITRNLRRMKPVSTSMKISFLLGSSISTPDSRSMTDGWWAGRTWRPHRQSNATPMAGQHVSGILSAKKRDFLMPFSFAVVGFRARWTP